MQKTRIALGMALAFPLTFSVGAQTTVPAPAPPADAPTKSLGVVTVNSGQPTSLPTQIPTTISDFSPQPCRHHHEHHS